MKDKILPIGSVIKMKNSDIYLMIYGYVNHDIPIDGEKYDYFCCVYPTGVGSEKAIAVQKDKIDKVIFIGYQDAKFYGFVDLLNKQ